MGIKAKPLPSLGRLFQLFDLDKENGFLLHKKKCGTKRGSTAGNVTPQGYRRVKIDGSLYLTHRVIYFMAFGKDPGLLEVDHVNGDKSDSRPENLRLATRHQNRQNVGTYSNNTTKHKGTWFDKQRRLYFCAVQCDGVREQFGPFETLKEAADIYQKEAKDRFGDFYRRAHI